MTISTTRILAELLRVATREERRAAYSDAPHCDVGDNLDFDALDELIRGEHPLVGHSIPRRLTEDGARIVGELLATFEEQI
jgi:hypothetical protein